MAGRRDRRRGSCLGRLGDIGLGGLGDSHLCGAPRLGVGMIVVVGGNYFFHGREVVLVFFKHAPARDSRGLHTLLEDPI